jgi:hypothetical protein
LYSPTALFVFFPSLGKALGNVYGTIKLCKDGKVLLKHKTEISKKINPTWRNSFTFSALEVHRRWDGFVVEIWQKQSFSSKLLGSVLLSRKEVEENQILQGSTQRTAETVRIGGQELLLAAGCELMLALKPGSSGGHGAEACVACNVNYYVAVPPKQRPSII